MTGGPTADGDLRRVERIANTQVVLEGAGVPVRRVLPSRSVPYAGVDPFLLLDHFRAERSAMEEGFPPHPHRGFEIVTYILEGSARHSDSEGNDATVKAGGLQRITAGRGIWHGEGAGGESTGALEGLQLWVNLAQQDKRIDPSYQGVDAEQLPERQLGDARVKVLVGEGAPTVLQTPATYLDVTVPPAGQADVPLPATYQGFVYVLAGDVTLGSNQERVVAGQVAVLGAGETLPLIAGAEGSRFVVAAGQPHREPVRWSGPFVD
jgi:redox-sensitive bicupin YhaK (pirin superfamily)